MEHARDAGFGSGVVQSGTRRTLAGEYGSRPKPPESGGGFDRDEET